MFIPFLHFTVRIQFGFCWVDRPPDNTISYLGRGVRGRGDLGRGDLDGGVLAPIGDLDLLTDLETGDLDIDEPPEMLLLERDKLLRPRDTLRLDL